ncbi:hypothetical protein BGZ89_010532 [Linnemannia elongata]|nr:hypothetical protein BGZ89_010532 [Linnemannia elongata]
MDSLSCLPSEILHLILQELARDSKVGSLAALLQTSKYLATATLPVLYNNLFQDNFHVMLHALGANKTATQPTKICSSLDYFAHIRHLNLRPEAIVLDHFWSQGDPPSEASACMQGPEFSQIYQTYSFLQSLIWRFELTCEPLHIYYRAVLYREINWHLTSRILEQLKSISISVSDLNRFYSIMSRLGSLEHMEFILDEAIDYNWDYFGSMSGELMSSSISREVEPLPAMIQFVREHTRRFPGCLKTVSCSNGGLWHELEQKWPEETKLEILGVEMDTLGPGTFKWAIQEKKALDSEKGVSWLDKSRSVFLYLEHGLVSLEKVHLKDGAGHPLTDELDDIAFAFDQTLKSIRFSSFCLSSAASRPIHLGRGWLKLPALEHVSFYTRGVVLDRNFFKLCPSLKSVRLYDGSDPDRCQDVLTCLPADLPCLESLNTSHGSLDYQDDAIETIMPTQARAAEIVQTLWTWDWHLPSLNHLALTGEFAYQFQFRMLNGCPALEKLDLNNKTFDGRLDRVLSYADLFLPGSVDSNDDNPAGAPRQAVVAPALQCLRLMGSWRVDDSLLPQFLTAMTPNLDILDAFGLNGFTLKALADVVKTQPNTIKKVYFRCPEPSPKSSVVNAGLLHHVNTDSMKRQEEARFVRVHFAEVTYFVMKDVTIINDGSE